MKAWLWITLSLGLLCISTLGLIYQYAGLKYWLRANAYASANQEIKNRLYGFAKNGVYGGIFAGTWNGKVGIWGRNGLKFFRGISGSEYRMIDGCRKNPALGPYVVDKYSDPYSWISRLEPGDYVFVKGENLDKPTEFQGANFWVFTNEDLETQCLRGDGQI